MRNPKRRAQEMVFPVTEDDWREAHHDEDPADRRNQVDVERALETTEAGRYAGLTVLTPYQH